MALGASGDPRQQQMTDGVLGVTDMRRSAGMAQPRGALQGASMVPNPSAKKPQQKAKPTATDKDGDGFPDIKTPEDVVKNLTSEDRAQLLKEFQQRGVKIDEAYKAAVESGKVKPPEKRKITDGDRAALILEFGLRMMAESQENSFGGAVGKAGLGTMASKRALEGKYEQQDAEDARVAREDSRYNQQQAASDRAYGTDMLKGEINLREGAISATDEAAKAAADRASRERIAALGLEGDRVRAQAAGSSTTRVLTDESGQNWTLQPDGTAKMVTDESGMGIRSAPKGNTQLKPAERLRRIESTAARLMKDPMNIGRDPGEIQAEAIALVDSGQVEAPGALAGANRFAEKYGQ